MSAKKIFASNLRRLCASHKSHAAVALDLGINRQQFNSYVSGRNLPNEGIIDRICKYFGVEIEVLFRSEGSETELAGFKSLTIDQKKVISQFVLHERLATRSNISKGLYYIFFEFPGEPDKLVCSLLAIEKDGILTTFRRITRMTRGVGLLLLGANGVHKGIVLKRANSLFMVAFDTVDDFLPSILVAEAASVSSVLYSGIAQVMAPTKFNTVRFCIVPTNSTKSIWSHMCIVRAMHKNEIRNSFVNVYKFFFE